MSHPRGSWNLRRLYLAHRQPCRSVWRSRSLPKRRRRQERPTSSWFDDKATAGDFTLLIGNLAEAFGVHGHCQSGGGGKKDPRPHGLAIRRPLAKISDQMFSEYKTRSGNKLKWLAKIESALRHGDLFYSRAALESCPRAKHEFM